MLSVKAKFQGGVALPLEPVQGREGSATIITFLDEGGKPSATKPEDGSWDDLEAILEECRMETGISDLADQHDHYVHGTPKRR